ncbi:hypothetical protein ACFGY8_04260 [Pasteurella multocida]
MANSNTEHSKKLRAKNAAEYNKKVLASGQAKRILMQLPADVANAFDSIAAELGVSRPECLRILCESYRAN